MVMDWEDQYYENGYVTKTIYMFNAISIKIPMIFIIDIEKLTLNLIWKHKRQYIAKGILRKKEQY
jgi:hypothetical protein